MEPLGGAAWGLGSRRVMPVALRHGRLRLAEVAPQAGLKYQAAAQAVKRFGQALAGDAERKRFASVLRRKL